MATRILNPVSRLEGHLSIEVDIDTLGGLQQVTSARARGTMFRGFELLLAGRPPRDAPHIAQRICGVCPVAQGLAAVLALEAAGGVAIPAQGRILRQLVLGADFLSSHLLHFYQLSLLDFVAGPDRAPWQSHWSSDLRLTGTTAQTLVNHYLGALAIRRKAHEVGALFGGRMPHPPSFVLGGMTTTPRAERVTQADALLDEIIAFVQEVWLADVETVGAAYGDYFSIGVGTGNLLSYGGFDLDATGTHKLLSRGRVVGSSTTIEAVDAAAITESVAYAYFQGAGAAPPTAGQTVPMHTKAEAYSWMKAPRYGGEVYEVGPLARMWIEGDYQHGISVLDRHAARAAEALKIAQAMKGWLTELDPAQPVCAAYEPPADGQGVSLVEAPRGALGHWVSLAGGGIATYQIVTPTCWNASPRDDTDLPGALEHALVGTPVLSSAEPVEVLRVVHSFDPCLACAVHVL